MSKIQDAFKGKKAFIPYLMAGDPDIERTRAYILTMAAAGADLVEIGIPFSDPIAEGGMIQAANLRAFASHTTLDQIFRMVDSLKGEVSIPLLLMTYVNPVFNRSYETFFAECAACGVSGVILPDLPFEEQGEVRPHARRNGVELISLIAPTSGKRIERIARAAEGYIYLVSSMGVTGVRNEIAASNVAPLLREIRKYTSVPVAVGFGIHDPRQAAELSQASDGVIVGSAVVNIIAAEKDQASARLGAYVRAMKDAMNAGAGVGAGAEAGSEAEESKMRG
jgi:tryptophan synthase alpha chain